MRAPTGRRRGGQPHNHNRLKHGLYARQLPIQHELRLERLGLNRREMGIALARARLKMLLTQQAAAGPKDFLTYERAIQRYIVLIGQLIQRNSDLRLETGIATGVLQEVTDLLKDLDDEQ